MLVTFEVSFLSTLKVLQFFSWELAAKAAQLSSR